MSAEKTYTLELTQAEARALCAAYQGEGLASVATWDEWTTVHRLLHAAADLLRSELAKLDGQPQPGDYVQFREGAAARWWPADHYPSLRYEYLGELDGAPVLRRHNDGKVTGLVRLDDDERATFRRDQRTQEDGR